MTDYRFTPIGYVNSCYKEKFGIPRQPALVEVPASIEIKTEYSKDDAFRELESFSHIWVIFVFHGVDNKWNSMVRPPRLGGNKRVGVFASRSMFRPNPIGLSVVELKSIERKANSVVLNIIGGDFLDQTPVLDIKPYIPYSDAIKQATAGYAIEQPPVKLSVVFSPQASIQISDVQKLYPEIKNVIRQVLQLDPRPAYQEHKDIKSDYAIKLYQYDIKWQVDESGIIVTDIKNLV